MADDEALWNQIDNLRDQQAVLAQGIAVVKHEQEQCRQRDLRTAELLAKLDAKIDVLSIDLHEAKGGLRFGKWLAGVTTSLIAVWIAFATFVKGGT